MKTASKRKHLSAPKSSTRPNAPRDRRPGRSKRPSRYDAHLNATADKSPSVITEAITHQLLEDARTPDDWSKVTRGSLCLALENIGDGWFEAVVQKIDGERLTLLWRDYPDYPSFTRTIGQLALRHPKLAKPC